jgi:hypothetical protein
LRFWSSPVQRSLHSFASIPIEGLDALPTAPMLRSKQPLQAGLGYAEGQALAGAMLAAAMVATLGRIEGSGMLGSELLRDMAKGMHALDAAKEGLQPQ